MTKNKKAVKELYDHILKHLTAEEALMKMLESGLIQYDKLKFDSQDEAVHPEIIIVMATVDLGWSCLIEGNRYNIEGLTIGTKEYLDRIHQREIL